MEFIAGMMFASAGWIALAIGAYIAWIRGKLARFSFLPKPPTQETKP